MPRGNSSLIYQPSLMDEMSDDTDIQLNTLSRRLEVFNMKIIKSTTPTGGVFQMELKWFNLKTV